MLVEYAVPYRGRQRWRTPFRRVRLHRRGCSSEHFLEAVPRFTLAFLVENSRDLDPPIEFAGTRLAPLEVESEEARNRLNEELGPARTKLLAENGGRLTVV